MYIYILYIYTIYTIYYYILYKLFNGEKQHFSLNISAYSFLSSVTHFYNKIETSIHICYNNCY